MTSQKPVVEVGTVRKEEGFRCSLENLTACSMSYFDYLDTLALKKSGRTASWREPELLIINAFPKESRLHSFVSLAKAHKNGSNKSQGRKTSLLVGTARENS